LDLGLKPKSWIVILGGLGFIGSHLVRAFVRMGFPVRIFDKLYTSHELIKDIESSVEVIEGDVQRPQDVLDALSGGEICFHLIHTTVPGSSMEDPGFDAQSNIVSSARWMSRLNHTSLKRIFFVSSGGTVYGIPQTNPISEDHPTNPICSYGISKLCIEKYALLYGRLCGIETRILRPSNTYGEGQKLNISQGLVGVFANRALRGEPIEVWGDGTVQRDYLHVDDLISAMLHLTAYRGSHQIFNIATGEGHPILEILELLAEILGRRPQIHFLPPRGFDVPVNILSPSRLIEETGWRPCVGLREGMERYVQWLKNNQGL
jgi:UDP-glucose 4-epimerase